MKVSLSDLRVAGKVIESASEAAATVVSEVRASAGNLLRREALPGVAGAERTAHSAPAILSERMGTMITSDKIRTFSESLYKRASLWNSDSEFRTRILDSTVQLSATGTSAKAAFERVGVSIDDWYRHTNTAEIYSQLTEPGAQRAYTAFLKARTELRDVASEYSKTIIGPRVSQIRQVMNEFSDDTGMFRPQLKFRLTMDSQAAYGDGKVWIPENALLARPHTLANSLSHEDTHLEQNILQVALKADEMNIGATATKAQIQEMLEGFGHMKDSTSEKTIAKAIATRNGRFLTDEAAERAVATSKSTQDFFALQNKERPRLDQLSSLNFMTERMDRGVDITHLLGELAHPTEGLAFNNELFGAARGAELFAKHTSQMDLLRSQIKLPNLTKERMFVGLYEEVSATSKAVQEKLQPYQKAYRDSRHEVEAHANGALAESFYPHWDYAW